MRDGWHALWDFGRSDRALSEKPNHLRVIRYRISVQRNWCATVMLSDFLNRRVISNLRRINLTCDPRRTTLAIASDKQAISELANHDV